MVNKTKAEQVQRQSALLGSQDVGYGTEASEVDDLASQQETKRIYLIQQVGRTISFIILVHLLQYIY